MDYRAFLGGSHGLEKEGVYLYPAEEVPERNAIFNIQEYSREYLNIGNNGGGMAYVLSLQEPYPVFLVGHGSMHPDDLRLIDGSFAAWVVADFPLPAEDDKPGWGRLVDVYLEKQPAGGVKDVHLIRRVLSLEIGLSLLVKRSADAPIALLEGVPYGLYWERVEEINRQCGDCLSIREVTSF